MSEGIFYLIQLMREYLLAEHQTKKNAELSLDGWTDYSPKDCPAQNNGYDCGVFACMLDS
jgi:Ulp1 family protease